jgi:cephalosporin-C deacetylase-like acetyl esterase
MVEQTVVDLRVAIDILVSAAHVDPARVGFVGHSWGASTGAILAAVDERPIAFVLITGRPSWTDYVRSVEEGRLSSIAAMLGPEKWAAYLAALEPLDADQWLPRATAAELLLQFGTTDDVVLPAAVDAFVAAAPDGTTVKTYDAGHVLDAAATADRAAWLAGRLGVEPPSAAALAEVGLPDAATPLP